MNNRKKFFVHVDTGDGIPVVAGYYQLDRNQNQGVFFYGKSYCQNPRSFAIDPINLPLVYNQHYMIPTTRFNPAAIPGALLDSGPDEWGKRIINRLADPKPLTQADYLVMGSGFGVGALYFSDTADALHLPEMDAADELLQLYQSAIAMDSDMPNLQSVAEYLMPSSGIGGARPKAPWLHGGKPCIAKFNRLDDPFDNALAEHCMLKLATEVGIHTAQSHLLETELGHVCAVERFDCEGKVRRHILSANALLNLVDIEQLNQTSYSGIMEIGQKIGKASAIAYQLFTRMLFNIAIGNTDDHSRNHAFIKDLTGQGYELSPAYDLVPVPYRIGSHAINIGPFGQAPHWENIRSAGKLMGLSLEDQRTCALSVYSVVNNIEERLQVMGMHSEDVDYLSRCFQYKDLVGRLAEE